MHWHKSAMDLHVFPIPIPLPPQPSGWALWTVNPLQYSWASLVAQTVKNPPAVWETWGGSLGQEDPLKEDVAAHSSILPGESHGQRSLVGYSPWVGKELDTTEQLSTATSQLKWKNYYLKYVSLIFPSIPADILIQRWINRWLVLYFYFAETEAEMKWFGQGYRGVVDSKITLRLKHLLFFLSEINSFTSATDQVPDGKNLQSLPPRATFKPMKGLYLIISPLSSLFSQMVLSFSSRKVTLF